MQYIKKAKNTKMRGRLPDDFITEVVDESMFTEAHRVLGGYEKVTNKECDRLCNNNSKLMEGLKEDNKLVAIIRDQTSDLEAEELRLEFEEFKAWRASQI